MIKKFFFVILMFSFSIYAQNSRRCGFKDVQHNIQSHPNYNDYLVQKKLLEKSFYPTKSDTVITIPVVVHVIYKSAAENITYAQIKSQIDVLNEDFRKLNFDTTNVASGFSKADVKFEFSLAIQDPNGNFTSGITRNQTNEDNICGINKNQYYKLVPAWNNNRYLNIWVCDAGELLGFAYPPNAPGVTADEDGVVIGPEYFGTSGTAIPPYNLGRTTTHEVAHYFDLLHLWGNDQNPNCSSDDQIADTPNQGLEIYDCPNSNVSCGSADMLSNFLQYTDDNCMGNFTLGQKARMRNALYMSRDSLQFGEQLGLVGIKEFRIIDNTSVFPVPFRDYLNIQNNKISNWNNIIVSLFNANGKLLEVKTNSISNGLKLNISNLKSGIYFLRLVNGNSYTFKKIIKQ